jgi:adenylate kinase
MKKNSIVEIVGIPGSGKSHLTSKLAGVDKKRNYFGFGDIIREMLSERGIAHGMFENLSLAFQHELIQEGINMVVRNQPAVVNTHTVYRTKNNPYTVDLASEAILRCSAYIHIVTPIPEVMRRINSDRENGKRYRKYGAEELQLMEKISLMSTEYLARISHSDFHIIQNVQDAPEPVESLLEIIQHSM